MARQLNKNFLVALLKNQNDLNYVLEENWYRIPTWTKHVPLMVKEGTLKHIAFYNNRHFKENPLSIKYYADVDSISVVKGKQLIPSYTNEPKGDQDYYKINLRNVRQLKVPIESKRRRRILFINTTMSRFRKAKEINDLFIESYLEEKMWDALRNVSIDAERQYYFRCTQRGYILDFVLFCRDRNINIECDGDKYHLTPNAVKKDKVRDNRLTSLGWSVLRYSYDDIMKSPGYVLSQIKETIVLYGGLETEGLGSTD